MKLKTKWSPVNSDVRESYLSSQSREPESSKIFSSHDLAESELSHKI